MAALTIARKFFPDEEEKKQLQLGIRMIMSCPLLEKGYDHRSFLVVQGKQEVKESVVDDSQKIAELFPCIKPMIVKPLQWNEGEQEGGYLSIRRPMINNKHKTTKAPGNKVLASANKVQNTAFRVNNEVLDVAIALGATEDIPNRKRKGESKKGLAGRIRSITTSNASLDKVMGIAKEYRDFENIYFPIYLDYRGRIYYAPQHFNPQGSDLSKSLIHFSKGKPITSKGAVKWFKIHIANLAGNDKLPLGDRVKWVNRNHDKLINWATDPVNNTGWKEGAIAKDGKIWQFLASIIEYKSWVENGDKHISHLPIALDAVCSGVQFWSGLLRDQDGANSVSMMPSKTVSDIYTDVLDVMKAFVEGTTEEQEEYDIAQEWIKSLLMTRKLAKTPVMTICYSAGRNAFTKFVGDFCKDKPFKDRKKAINYMVSVIIESIDQIVKVQRGMVFLKNCANEAGSNGIDYLSYIGFHVVHKPVVSYKNIVQTTVDGQRFQMTLMTKTDKIDTRKIQTAIAPNFVHNLDATLLLMTINACPGINSWQMVHDSYAVLAEDVPEMAQQVRKCFVELLSQPLLERFRESTGAHNVKLPAMGSYELKNVLKSPYFFN